MILFSNEDGEGPGEVYGDFIDEECWDEEEEDMDIVEDGTSEDLFPEDEDFSHGEDRSQNEMEIFSNLAIKIVGNGCTCGHKCFLNCVPNDARLSFQHAYDTVYKIVDRHANLKKNRQLEETMVMLMAPKTKKVKGRIFWTYTVGNITVCKDAFMSAYQLTSFRLKKIAKTIKLGLSPTSERRISDRSRRLEGLIVEDLVKIIGPKSDRAWQALNVPNSPESLTLVAWLTSFFEQVGESPPDGPKGQLDLEPMTKKEIWEEYLVAMRNLGEEAVHLRHFTRIWSECFPFVKIREHKGVCGKCNTCAALSLARTKYWDPTRRAKIALLHSLHRKMYMGERLIYYGHRIMRSDAVGNSFVSIIMDGMAQSHNELPWNANLEQFPKKFAQHLQGVLEHGKAFRLYRTFNNVKLGANLSIQTLLLTFEDIIKRDGKLPDVLLLRVDGGPENSNLSLPAFAEFLVHHGVLKKVLISRHPVGHTHEDIDGKYGTIWTYIWPRHIVTPQEYKAELLNAFANDNSIDYQPVYDIYVLPAYDTWLAPYIDKNLTRFRNEEMTQLVWKFERVLRSIDYVLGVKTMYRAYSQDEVFTIIEDRSPPTNETIGLKWKKNKIVWQPIVSPHNCNLTEGMYILQSVPRGRPEPAPFQEDYRKQLDATVRAIKKVYEFSNPSILEDWNDFADAYPTTNDVNEYVRDHPMHYPLGNLMFEKSAELIASQQANWNVFHDHIDLQNVEENTVLAMDSVQWSNRGGKRPFIPERVHYHSDMTVQQMIDVEVQQPFQYWRDLVNPYLLLACKARAIYVTSNANKTQLVDALEKYDRELIRQHITPSNEPSQTTKEYWEVLTKDILIDRSEQLGLRVDVGQGKTKKKEDYINVLMKYAQHNDEEMVKKRIKIR